MNAFALMTYLFCAILASVLVVKGDNFVAKVSLDASVKINDKDVTSFSEHKQHRSKGEKQKSLRHKSGSNKVYNHEVNPSGMPSPSSKPISGRDLLSPKKVLQNTQDFSILEIGDDGNAYFFTQAAEIPGIASLNKAHCSKALLRFLDDNTILLSNFYSSKTFSMCTVNYNNNTGIISLDTFTNNASSSISTFIEVSSNIHSLDSCILPFKEDLFLFSWRDDTNSYYNTGGFKFFMAPNKTNEIIIHKYFQGYDYVSSLYLNKTGHVTKSAVINSPSFDYNYDRPIAWDGDQYWLLHGQGGLDAKRSNLTSSKTNLTIDFEGAKIYSAVASKNQLIVLVGNGTIYGFNTTINYDHLPIRTFTAYFYFLDSLWEVGGNSYGANYPSMAISPDGANIYVTTSQSNGIFSGAYGVIYKISIATQKVVDIKYLDTHYSNINPRGNWQQIQFSTIGSLHQGIGIVYYNNTYLDSSWSTLYTFRVKPYF